MKISLYHWFYWVIIIGLVICLYQHSRTKQLAQMKNTALTLQVQELKKQITSMESAFVASIHKAEEEANALRRELRSQNR